MSPIPPCLFCFFKFPSGANYVKQRSELVHVLRRLFVPLLVVLPLAVSNSRLSVQRRRVVVY